MQSVKPEIVIPELGEVRNGDFAHGQESQPHSWERWWPYCSLLWAKRRFLYKAGIASLAFATLVAFLLPKRYESTTTIMPPDSLSGNNMMMAALAGKASPELAGMAASALGLKSTGELFLGLLRSRSVEEGIVDQFRLQSVYWVRYKQDARKELEHHTEISEDRKTGIITVTVSDRQPQRAHDMAQAYVEELNHLVSQVSTSSARRERMFIEQRLAAVKSDLEDAEQQFSTFASKNTTLDITEQTKAMVESTASLQGRLMAAESELEGLRQIYSPNNVRVRSLQAQINELKQQLSRLGGTDAPLGSESSTSESPNPDQLYPPIRKLPLLGVQWADLFRRVKIQETIYGLLNQQYELARIQEAKEIPTVNLIDPPNFPEKKSWPPRLLIIAGLTILALAAVIAKIILTERVQSLDESDPRRQIAMAGIQKWQEFRARVPGLQRGEGTQDSNGSPATRRVHKD